MTTIRRVSSGGNNDEAEYAALPHVLLVVDQLSETFGGGERIALKLASLLPKYGYRASVLTFSVHPGCNGLKSPPYAVYLLPLRRTYDFDAIRAAFSLRQFIRRERVQIVQTFFESSDIWAGVVTKTMSGAKLIWSRRDMGILRGRKHDVAYRLLSGMPDTVFAVSEQVRQHGIEVDGIAPSRVQTVYNGLDISHWKTISRPPKTVGRVTIGTLGNIRRVKGHDVFIRAAAMVVRDYPEVSFRIAGEILEQDYFKELETLIRELELENHFQFVAGVANPQEFLFATDIFVLPSRSEGFSNAIIEAMAASLPVIATNVGGNAEAVEDGVSGLIVAPEDAPALAAAISQLLVDPEKALKMGSAGRKRVEEKFTIDAMMRRITRVYDGLLGNNIDRGEADTIPYEGNSR
jgi:glycosyltransferase involved in cell wall biosynthesis